MYSTVLPYELLPSAQAVIDDLGPARWRFHSLRLNQVIKKSKECTILCLLALIVITTGAGERFAQTVRRFAGTLFISDAIGNLASVEWNCLRTDETLRALNCSIHTRENAHKHVLFHS